MRKQSKYQSLSVACGALLLAAIALTGCGQKETADPAAAAPPAAVAPAPPAAITPAATVPKGGEDAHRATLQAQSDYWRKHGQGLNEAPPAKPKQ